ncbi:response regulator [Algoriphagus yeomjeoni]|uniref:Response regulator receiver domain-containing protein n=1 Tax=Algoriphagus yeomjeoni TaxID=291403 RepID=A0A327PSJ8_9BACT|nr:response regulator [Algoriphagus yeomjeoni]RAI94763.1 response regulator receiver domain-containing protein [Algoriphagus yeomjeoni]
MAIQAINILLVEDNEGDIVLLTEALSDAKMVNKIDTLGDGAEAIDLLDGLAIKDSDTLPDLILLDINLPKINGYEVIDFMKTNALLENIPVIILTTSSSELENIKAKNLEAYCYIIKPVEIDEYVNVVSKIEEFWLSTLNSKTRT